MQLPLRQPVIPAFPISTPVPITFFSMKGMRFSF